MKIEKITKKGYKYKIILDDGKEIYTYEEVILKNGLLYHRFINDKLLDKIYNDTNYYKSYNKVIDMISRRLRSEYEIEKYLKKKEVDDKDINDIIINLKKIGLIDDRMYAKAYTNDRINLSLDGPYKIKRHLEDNKIKIEYINEAIDNINEEIIKKHIDKIIQKKIKNNKKYPPYMLKQKITIYLVNLGYSREDALRELEKYKIEKLNLEKEMDKVFNKLNKKYEGRMLEYHLKNKLYTKGFTKEEIDEYIKNSSLF